jgi:hypothetical protein
MLAVEVAGDRFYQDGEHGKVGEATGLPHRVVADASHHYEPGVEAPPHLKADPPPTLEFFPIPLQGLPNSERRMDGALRVILVGDRGAEESHDAVPEELVHGALVAVHLGQHQFEGAIHQPVNVFRVEPLGERGEPRDIHVEDRHLLALRFEGAPGGQDLLGEVFWGVGFRRSEVGLPGGRGTDRLPALETEFGGRRQLGTAQGARQCETAATLQAKLRLRRALMLAPRALHVGPLLWPVRFREATTDAPKITHWPVLVKRKSRRSMEEKRAGRTCSSVGHLGVYADLGSPGIRAVETCSGCAARKGPGSRRRRQAPGWLPAWTKPRSPWQNSDENDLAPRHLRWAWSALHAVKSFG